MQIKKTIVIKAPIWHVWDCFDDIEKQKKWMTNLIDIDTVDEDYSIAYVKEGNYVNIYKEKILLMDPPFRLQVYMFDDKRKIDIYFNYNLHQEGNYTTLDFVGETKTYTMMMKLSATASGGFFSKVSMNKYVNNIKNLAEETYKSED